jgi:hypothetical protein
MNDRDLSFGELFEEIAATRARYEALRSFHGSLDERARLVSRLHTLRAQMADLRNTGI